MNVISTRESYDEIPYPGLTYNQTHPDRLSTLASLMGMKTTPVERCRFLDIGCGNGVNLFPMAFSLPESEFMGIDYSNTHITQGQQAIQELDLSNVRLECVDIADVPDDFPEFDYIVAHGVYSWVPSPVRDKLLEVIANHLAPNGVAYVSYNVFPGWRVLQIVRDAMRYHSRNAENPLERAKKAREMIDFLREALKENESVYSAFIESYYDLLKNKMDFGKGADSLLLHDELETVNEPVYFHEFAEHAARYGLQYISESALHSVMPTNLPKPVVKKLSGMVSGVVDTEQYMDFLKNRAFRQTLLCHQDVELKRTLRPNAMVHLRLFSRARCQSDEPDLSPGKVEHFEALDESVFSSEHPLTKAAFLTLNEINPRSLPFIDLVKLAATKVELGPDTDMEMEATRVAAGFLQAYTYSLGLVEFHTFEPHFVTEISDRPMASPVARWQQHSQLKVTNMRHERVTLEGFSELLLPHLDGQHSRDDLIALMLDYREKGLFKLKDEETAGDEDQVVREVTKGVDQNLSFLARATLLIG